MNKERVIASLKAGIYKEVWDEDGRPRFVPSKRAKRMYAILNKLKKRGHKNAQLFGEAN